MRRETDIGAAVVAYLRVSHWRVWQEVSLPAGRADIIAEQAGYVWAIECKLALTQEAYWQATRWDACHRSIAVSRHDRHAGRRGSLVRCSIGLLEVDRAGHVVETVPAPLWREKDTPGPDAILAALAGVPETQGRIAGSPGGSRSPRTREALDRLAEYVRENPGCFARHALAQLADLPWRTPDAVAKAVACSGSIIVSHEVPRRLYPALAATQAEGAA